MPEQEGQVLSVRRLPPPRPPQAAWNAQGWAGRASRTWGPSCAPAPSLSRTLSAVSTFIPSLVECHRALFCAARGLSTGASAVNQTKCPFS